jgi:preprotein translocase subunit SecA
VNKALETAQKKVEARNFEIRKNILKYDDVMNDQRKVVFEQRRELMAAPDLIATVTDMRHAVVEEIVSRNIPEGAYPEAWNVEGLKEETARYLALDLPVDEWAREEGIADEEIRERLTKAADEAYAGREQKNTPDLMRYIERQVVLQTLDHLWREHLVTLDHLRQVIGWRGYAQRDPLNEFKSEAFELYDRLLVSLRETVTGQLMRVEVVFDQPAEGENPPGLAGQEPMPLPAHVSPIDRAAAAYGVQGQTEITSDDPTGPRDSGDPATWGKVGRNEPCPCGSGRKFKHCHGRFA